MCRLRACLARCGFLGLILAASRILGNFAAIIPMMSSYFRIPSQEVFIVGLSCDCGGNN